MTHEYILTGPTVMMTLGAFQFGITTAAYQDLSRSTDYRWGSQELFMKNPALQYVGPGSDTINLPGVIYPEYRGGLGQINAMRSLAEQGEPLPMVDGNGFIMGDWVIERIEEKQTTFAAAGAPRKIEFSISLRKFDDAWMDAEAGPGAAVAAVVGPQSAADSAIAAAKRMGDAIGGAMAQVQAVTAQIGGMASAIITPVSRALDVANGLQRAARDVSGMMRSSKTAIGQASGLRQLVNAATSAATNSGQASVTLNRAARDLAALGTVPPSSMQAVYNAQAAVNRLTVGATSMRAATVAQIETLNETA